MDSRDEALNKMAYVAARKYGIPDQTLHDRINGKVKDNAKVGRCTLLLPDEEMEIVVTCIIFAYGMDKLKVMKMVQSYLKYHKRKLSGKNTQLEYDWFLQRHKAQLSVRKTQKLQMVRAKAATPELLNH